MDGTTARLWTVSDVAKFLGCAEITIRKYVAAGTIPYAKVGPRHVRFRPQAIAAWVEAQERK